ncbi:MAG: ATP:cob(I)alamin adenosyltransferase [Acidobacteria bacterium]|nr:MAG: ATP:cob(I)alamin adenosyltransferase [Acidobacteriota bacterium]
MSIYTRKGDSGNTRLFSGEQVSKDDLRVQTYGTLDEFQAQLGLARSFIQDGELNCMVYAIQQDVSAACAELASNPETFSRLKRRVGRADAGKLEKQIDALVADYGLPHGFVIPGRATDSAAMHVARTVCRRSERLLVMLNREVPEFDELLVYFNRLSDLLFVLAWALEVMHVVRDVAAEAVKEGAK